MPLSFMDNYISIRQILDDVLDHPMMADLSFERAVNHAVHFIRIVGCPRMFVEKTAVVDIDNYRGVIPCDYNSIVQVRTYGDCGHNHQVFRCSTDTFHMSQDKHSTYDLTYKIQGGVIYTSIKEGKIEIAYLAFNADNEGYPMIPDNSSFIQALEAYIKKKHFNILFDQGKITPAIFNQVCQDYAWYVGQAQSELVKPTIDQMQAITNMWNTLVPRVSEHKHHFAELGTKEHYRTHR